MQFRGMEDRLNPVAPAGTDESTLAGYSQVHGRAPGFEGSDGMPYTVAVETEPAGGETDEWVAYLVFLRWAADSTAIMGHVETEDLAQRASESEARTAVGSLSLVEVKRLLDEAISRRQET